MGICNAIKSGNVMLLNTYFHNPEIDDSNLIIVVGSEYYNYSYCLLHISTLKNFCDKFTKVSKIPKVHIQLYDNLIVTGSNI